MDFDPRACQPSIPAKRLCFTATSHPCRSLSHSSSPLRVQNFECSPLSQTLSLPCKCHRRVRNSDSFSVSLYDRHHPSWSYPSKYISMFLIPDRESLMRRTKQDHCELILRLLLVLRRLCTSKFALGCHLLSISCSCLHLGWHILKLYNMYLPSKTTSRTVTQAQTRIFTRIFWMTRVRMHSNHFLNLFS